MITAVNAHARQTEGRTEYPMMFGAGGWYGPQPQPWSVGALEGLVLVDGAARTAPRVVANPVGRVSSTVGIPGFAEKCART